LIKSNRKIIVQLETASSKAITSRNSVELYIKLGKLSWKFRFLVVSDLPYPVILGADFIKHSKMMLNLACGEISFNYAQNDQINFIKESEDQLGDNDNSKNERVVLTEEQEEKLKGLLHNFTDVITPKIGRAKVKDYEIKIQDNCKPVRCRPFQLDPEKNKAMRSIIDKLLEIMLLARVSVTGLHRHFWSKRKSRVNTD